LGGRACRVKQNRFNGFQLATIFDTISHSAAQLQSSGVWLWSNTQPQQSPQTALQLVLHTQPRSDNRRVLQRLAAILI